MEAEEIRARILVGKGLVNRPRISRWATDTVVAEAAVEAGVKPAVETVGGSPDAQILPIEQPQVTATRH